MSDAPIERLVLLKLPRKLAFLLEMHPYKIAYSGRNGLKSRSYSAALLTLGLEQRLRIMCVREIQETLRDSSHQLLVDQIQRLKFNHDYAVTDDAIRCRHNGTLFRFRGLSDLTAESAKALEGLDIVWADEMQAIRRRSFQIMLPTLFRTPNAEFWGCFNPNLSTDESWERFVVHPPPGAVVVEMNYRDAIAAGWWNDEQERLRQYDMVYSPLEYDNIWEGRPRSFVPGAIYGREITDMVREGRFRPTPYDPRLPVHRVWDLGWNDLMTVIMVQKPTPTVVNVINYIEEKFVTYAGLLQTLALLGYRVGTDWLPHDATQHHPTSGTNAVKLLRDLGCRVKVIPLSNPEARIRAARMMSPRAYLDTSKHDTPPDRPDQALGAGHLMDRLKAYRRNVPKITNEPTTPFHGKESHGADAYGGLAEIVDQIRNDGDAPPIKVPAFTNSDASMGMLG
jgi:phage terminase large subunit